MPVFVVKFYRLHIIFRWANEPIVKRLNKIRKTDFQLGRSEHFLYNIVSIIVS